MDRPFTEQEQVAIIAQWQQGERLIDSVDIYAQLVKAGVSVPAGALGAAR